MNGKKSLKNYAKFYERSEAYNVSTLEENNKGRNYMEAMCWGQGTLVAHI